MPFSRYLQSEPTAANAAQSNGLQFQIPSFMYSGAPTLAPGGGAEVLPYNSTWLTNTGFTNTYTPPSAATPKPSLLNIAVPSPLGLPVYSASGFDVLSILARVATRPNPRVLLGPVDMTCSFVVVDVRRHDHPVVYCSPTFCRLTGYDEHEILGRNCRFLQAPGGAVRRGEPRRFTSQQSVNMLRKASAADKEVQTSIVNFRKDGSAFINLVTVIPITGGISGGKHELNDIVYHVGFQVDLTQQPNIILERLRDGTYLPSEANIGGPAAAAFPQHDQPIMHRKTYSIPQITMSPTLSTLLLSKPVLDSLPISTTTTAPVPLPASANTVPPSSTNSPLSLLLCEYAPDFVHVVSLKGAFLYVAPSVTRVLGYTSNELVGKSMVDIAHPEDVVPLERQLKESSSLLPASSSSSSSASNDDPAGGEQGAGPGLGLGLGAVQARVIDVLFRARTKGGTYVWVECRGRLHVEPGKGRKAIILSGRARAMPRVSWGDVLRAGGGVAAATLSEPSGEGEGGVLKEREFWVQVAGRGQSAGAMVGVGAGVGHVLGYTPEELVGRRMGMLVVEGLEGVYEALKEDIYPAKAGKDLASEGEVVETMARTTTVWGRLRTKMGADVGVLMVFYRSARGGLDENLNVAPAPVLVQIRLLDDPASLSGGDSLSINGGVPASPVAHPLDANIFAELEVSRGSSWQYELQQLRFANSRLMEDIEALEAEVAEQEEKQEGDADGAQHDQEHSLSLSSSSSSSPLSALPEALNNNNPSPSSSEPSTLESMGFADLAAAGLSLGDMYPDMSLGMGMDIGGVGEHVNYTDALEQYAAAATAPARATPRPSATVVRGFGGQTELMPAPVAIPARASYQQRPHQPPNQPHQPPPRAQTPARIPPEQQRRQSVSLQQQQQQQGGLYAPVPLRSSMLLHAMGQGQQHLHQQQRAPSASRMEVQYPPQMQVHLQSLRGLGPSLSQSQSQSQMVTLSPLQQSHHDWGTLHQGVKRPLER